MSKIKAQSVLEYVIILAALIAFFVYAGTQWIGPAVTKAFTDAGTAINMSAGNFSQ